MNNEKNLPINFSPRPQDNGNTVGGGAKEDKTKWLLSGQELLQRSKRLISNLDEIESEWDQTSFEGLPHTLKVTFIKKAQANSHQRQIIPMFIVGENTGQIGFVGEQSLIMKVDSKEKLKTIKDNFTDTQKNVHPISSLTEIETFKPELKIIDTSEAYKIVPLSYNDPTLDKRALSIIQSNLTSHNIDNELISYSSNIKAVRVPSIAADSLKFIRTLPIRSVEPISKVDLPFRVMSEQLATDFDLLDFNQNQEYPLVGLLDSGVAKNQLTQNWVTRGKGCNYPEDLLDTSHGTYIATLLIHGDVFGKNNDYSINGCKIIDVPIVPKFPIEENQLIENIESAVKMNPQIHVWNLSVSLVDEISDSEFSLFATALDQIQEKNNVIICKSAGNDGNFVSKASAGRLSVGAESIRALTVGSLNRDSDQYQYTVKSFPAPYSRHGPAPASVVKPDVSHFGGDLFAKTQSPSTIKDFEQVSDTASSDGLHLIHSVGTSFSAPKVARNIAELDLLTNHKYDLLTLKALEIHSARYAEVPPLDAQKRLDYLGYGKPANASDTIFSSSFASTLILQGKIQKSRRIDIMDFPYPEALIKNGYYTGRIKITLVYDPILIPNQGAQYCQSNLDIKFGTYDEKQNTTEFLSRFNPVKRVGAFNTLLDSNYGKHIMHNHPDYASERTLIRYGQKYHPVKKYAFDLSELQPRFKDDVSSSKHWFLFLEGHYRDYAESYAVRNQADLNIPYCLIITIEDPNQQAQVYDSTIQALDANNFVHNSVMVNNNIHLSN